VRLSRKQVADDPLPAVYRGSDVPEEVGVGMSTLKQVDHSTPRLRMVVERDLSLAERMIGFGARFRILKEEGTS